LASDVPGNAEQIKDGINGWLFECNDVRNLVLKINALLQDPGSIAKARQNLPIPKPFSLVALEYGTIYEELLNNRKQLS
jgi:glycosyltransferase involved in cell wall biosynthesis